MFSRLRQAIGVGTLLLLAALATTTGIVLRHTERSARTGAGASLEDSAVAVESTLTRLLLSTDTTLASLPALLANVADQDGQVSPQSADRLLGSLNLGPLFFRDLLLVRDTGQVWSAARPASRDRALPFPPDAIGSGASPDKLSLIGPVRNPQTGEWSLYAGRDLSWPGSGRLRALAELPLSTLAARLDEAAGLPGLRIAVEKPDGTLVASVPHDELGTGHARRSLMARLARDGRVAELPADAAGPALLAASRSTLYGDAAVTVSRELPDALAAWRRDRDWIVTSALVAGFLLAGAAAALAGALGRHDRMEAERNRARATLENAVEAMSDGFVLWDADDRFVTCNRRYRELYALSAPLLEPGTRFEDIVREGARRGQYPEAGTDFEGFVRRTLDWHQGDGGSEQRLLPGGRWLLTTERRMPDGGFVGIRTDITPLKTALTELAAANARERAALREVQGHNTALVERDRALRQQNLLFDAALNNMSHGLLMVDAAGLVIVCNRRFREMFGLVPDAECRVRVDRLFAAIGEAGLLSPASAASLGDEQASLAERRRPRTFVVTSAGYGSVSVTQRPMEGGGWIAIYEDVTQQTQAEHRIRFLAHHDDLTKLPNRVLFRQLIEAALAGTRADGTGLALLYLDLDKFKDVNDTLGHPVGDALLTQVADRLRDCVRGDEAVARLGGDEFAVFCRAVEAERVADGLASRIVEAVSAPYTIHGRPVTVGVSIGIAVATGGCDADTLLRHADLALYGAKAKGRGGSAVFEPGMAARLRARLSLESDLRRAVADQAFALAFQPIVDLSSGRVSGFEALLRWNDPGRGVVSPAEFIPLAEETGLIGPMGAWIVRRACLDAASLPGLPRLAVNLSPVQLKDRGIVDTVREALAESGLDPARLELEITETALLDDGDTTMAVLHDLRALGPRIVLDDFGTGFSSLSHLRLFPFGKIKIDQSFVREMTSRPDCAAIVGSTIDLARRLGMRTTAEGVETAEQLAQVRAFGCSEAQGYLFGRPGPILGAASLLAAPPVLPARTLRLTGTNG